MSFSILRSGSTLGGFGLRSAGSGLYNRANAEGIKDGIANSYDINAASRSYANKASVSSSNYAQQAQTIQYLLQNGRQDEASKKYNELLKEMSEDPYYQGYSQNELKTLLQEKYISSTGTSIVSDASANGKSAFVAGLNSSIPIAGPLLQLSSKDELVAKATGTSVSSDAKVASSLGTATGIAATTGIGIGLGALKGHSVAGGIIGGAVALGSTIINKIVKANKTKA